MRRVIAYPLLAACLTVAQASDDAQEGAAEIAAKATRLIAGLHTRAKRVTALHAFVRDSIKQVESTGRWEHGRYEPLARALHDLKGDQQTRTRLLGKLLIAIGEKPYLLRHGTGDSPCFLILLPNPGAITEALTRGKGAKPGAIRVANHDFVALPIEEGAQIGVVDEERYDPDRRVWTASIAVSRFR